MSQIQQPYQQPGQPAGKPPLVRLSTWVNVILVLILFASCAQNGNTVVSSPDESQIATEVVNQLQNDSGFGSGSVAPGSTEVEDLCRLLGAVAAKQGVPLTVMSSGEMTRCHEVAQEAATKAAP